MKPWAHAIVTIPLAYFSLAGDELGLNINTMSASIVLFSGAGLDFVDHLSIARIKKLLKGNMEPIPGRADWLHTWPAMLAIICIALLLGNALVFLAFFLHMVMDAMWEENQIKKPLPFAIRKCLPARLCSNHS